MRQRDDGVRRDVTLEVAEELCRAALDAAARLDALVSVAVVDGGGHLVRFSRLDGAEIAGPTLATDKAFTAVAHRIATANLAELVQPGAELYGLQANGDGRYVVFGGGIPLWSLGRVVGGVGVSGGTTRQDVACAKAALELWENGS